MSTAHALQIHPELTASDQARGGSSRGASATVQVTKEHYRPSAYEELHRWVSYWYQIQSVLRSGARSVLEIGVGSGVVSGYLRDRAGLEVTTFDFDESLRPDLAGDVRQLGAILRDRRFDAVAAFQVLEHLPFVDFAAALKQMAQASNRAVILSLPYYGYNLQARIRLWRWNWVFGRRISKNPKWSFDGEHYWELGTRGHSLARIRSVIEGVLTIERDYFCADYPYHYFFECRKREVQ